MFKQLMLATLTKNTRLMGKYQGDTEMADENEMSGAFGYMKNMAIVTFQQGTWFERLISAFQMGIMWATIVFTLALILIPPAIVVILFYVVLDKAREKMISLLNWDTALGWLAILFILAVIRNLVDVFIKEIKDRKDINNRNIQKGERSTKWKAFFVGKTIVLIAFIAGTAYWWVCILQWL